MQPTEVNAAGASSINVKVASEVSEALSLGRAVVALESTIISHGIIYLFVFFFCIVLFSTRNLVFGLCSCF